MQSVLDPFSTDKRCETVNALLCVTKATHTCMYLTTCHFA